MKLLSLIGAAIFSTSVFAISDFTCQFETREGASVSIEVDRAFGNPRTSRQVEMSVQRGSDIKNYNYFATPRIDRNFRNITFQGASFNLEINYWPDMRPTWGRDYRSTLRTWDIDNQVGYYDIYCRYVGIR